MITRELKNVDSLWDIFTVEENRLKISEFIEKCRVADSEALQLLQKLEQTL